METGPGRWAVPPGHDQGENFSIEQANWGLLPDGVAQLGHQMTDLGVTVLHSVLAHPGRPTAPPT
ncbi:hypothetical protein [Streptomyces sp. A1-5]|uniref:hypothetical protein n=1 Tax=Streptomyces sp. A1-5 TaxID=2738410 RepID=UPI001F259960|nr:hypothetical protein [Streptomyces sp. A1-5]UJB40506.1 hypothetical protein HRD51_06375 [Streptomyces sp. A1-5]